MNKICFSLSTVSHNVAYGFNVFTKVLTVSVQPGIQRSYHKDNISVSTTGLSLAIQGLMLGGIPINSCQTLIEIRPSHTAHPKIEICI